MLNFFMQDLHCGTEKTSRFRFLIPVPPKAVTQLNYYPILEVLPKLCALNKSSKGKKNSYLTLSFLTGLSEKKIFLYHLIVGQ